MRKLYTFGLCLAMAATAVLSGCKSTEDEPITPPQDVTGGKSDCTFAFEISDIGTYSVTVKVTPSDNDCLYYYSVVDSSIVEGIDSEFDGVEEYAEALMEYLYTNSPDTDSLLFSGEKTRTFDSGMVPEAHYYAFAVGVDPETHEFTTEFSIDEFDTEELTRPLFTFNVSDVTASSGAVTVKANNDGMKYLFEIATAQNIADVGNNEAAFDYIVRSYNAQIGYNTTWNDFLSWKDHKESAKYTNSLLGGTTYVVLAAGIENGKAYTEVESFEFTTEPVPVSNNKFDVYDEKGIVNIWTTNNDPYIAEIFYAQDVTDKSDEALIKKTLDLYGNAVSNNIHYGSKKFNFASRVDKFGDYLVVVFGYEGGATTGVTVYDYAFNEVNRDDYTNLPGDFSYVAEPAYGDYATVQYFGDFYANGGGNWLVSVNGYDGLLQAELVVDNFVSDSLEGTFEIDKDALYTYPVNKAYGGSMYFNGGWDDYCGTWLIMAYIEDETEGWLECDAAADSGTVKVSVSDIYTDDWGYNNCHCSIDVEFLDPKGNTVKYSYDGDDAQYTDASSGYYSLNAVSAVRPVTPRATLANFSNLTKMQIREAICQEAKARAAAHMKTKPQTAVAKVAMPAKAEAKAWAVKDAE